MWQGGKPILALISSMTANSAKPCVGRSISAPGGRTCMTVWRASRLERKLPRKGGRRGRSAARSARNSPTSMPRTAAWAAPGPAAAVPGCTGSLAPGLVKYNGQEAIRRDIDLLSSALRGVRTEEAFITAVSPATLQILANEHYKNQQDYT